MICLLVYLFIYLAIFIGLFICLAIFIGSFKLPYDKIKSKILEVDEEVIDGNALENLLKNVPTKEQVIVLYTYHFNDL